MIDINLQQLIAQTGVERAAVVTLAPVDDQASHLYEQWLEGGHHASMDYLERYADIRRDPRLLLPGAKSMICCALPYLHSPQQRPTLNIARYALGRDYHKVVRQRLEIVASRLRAEIGGETRVCVDTAPLRERYWAQRSGLGFIGLNNHLIVPGIGSYLFLGEILTTAELTPQAPYSQQQLRQLALDCHSCSKPCLRACPAKALNGVGGCNSERCLSYLTIEHRGPFSDESASLHGHFYGCDACQQACPHNSNPMLTTIADFAPRPEIMVLTAESILEMTDQQIDTLLQGSAMRRARPEGLRRNARSL